MIRLLPEIPVRNTVIRAVGNFVICWAARAGMCVDIAWLIVWAAGVPR
jgi:hypothetical protein